MSIEVRFIGRPWESAPRARWKRVDRPRQTVEDQQHVPVADMKRHGWRKRKGGAEKSGPGGRSPRERGSGGPAGLGALQARRPEILYWRTVDNAEVDFVVERRRRLLAIEVKATARPHPRDWRHLERFIAEYPESCHGAQLLHTGDEAYEVGDRIIAAPWWRVL